MNCADVPARIAAGTDRALAAAWFFVVASATFAGSSWTAPYVVWREFDNIYFQADLSLVFANMTDPNSNHYRTGMHPLFSIMMSSLVLALKLITGLDPMTCVRILLAANAGLLVSLGYLMLRRTILGRIDASVFALLLATTAATLCWGTVPETFAFGGTTVLVMLAIVALVPNAGVPLLVFGNLATMSMTLTNWMAGVYGTLALSWGRWRRIVRVFALAGVILLTLGVTSKLIFPSAGYVGDFRRYTHWVRPPQLSDLRSFLVHSIVMPEPIFRLRPDGAHEMVVEPASPGGGTGVGRLGAALWLLLLGLGIAGTLKYPGERRLRNVLLLTAGSQFLLHLCFADGPFLFSAHFAPLLVLVAAYALRFENLRWMMRSLAVAVAVLVAYNNLTVLERMKSRLDDDVLPWLQCHGTLMKPGKVADDLRSCLPGLQSTLRLTAGPDATVDECAKRLKFDVLLSC